MGDGGGVKRFETKLFINLICVWVRVYFITKSFNKFFLTIFFRHFFLNLDPFLTFPFF